MKFIHSFLKTLKQGIFSGGLFGFIIGLIISFYLLKLNFYLTFLFFCSFTILLIIYYGLIFLAFGLGLSILIYSFILITKTEFKKRTMSLTIFTFLIAFSVLFKERYIFPSLSFDFLSFKGTLVNLLIIAAVFLLSYLTAYLTVSFKKLKAYNLLKEHKLWAIILFLVSFYLTYQIITILATPEYIYNPYQKITLLETNEKVMFIGVDAVTKQVLEPLIEQGKLPNLQKLIETGGYDPEFQTAIPTKSPIVWTIMATGKEKSKNGISDFYKTKVFYSDETINALIDSVTLRTLLNKLEKFGFSQAYNLGSNDRITKAIWNILSENGKTVTLIGYYSTWPAEVVNGSLTVHDLGLYKEKTNQEITYSKEYLTYPTELLKELDQKNLIMGDYEVGIKEVSEFINEDYITKDFSIPHVFKTVIAIDKTNVNVALSLLKNKQTDYFFVYIVGIDCVQHIFWRHKEPDHFYPKLFSLFFDSARFVRPEENEREIYKGTIEKYYIYVDKLIGEILKYRDENTTIIIASDHGQSYAHHEYPFPGILIMNGGPIKQNIKLSDASIYDLTPTMLYLLGLPIAEDMDGKVLTEAITLDFLEEYPVKTIKTYETQPKNIKGMKDAKTEEEMEKLKSLGYIN